MIAKVLSICNKQFELNGKDLTEQRMNKTAKMTVGIISEALAQALRIQNPRFNRSKFLTACGITE